MYESCNRLRHCDFHLIQLLKGRFQSMPIQPGFQSEMIRLLGNAQTLQFDIAINGSQEMIGLSANQSGRRLGKPVLDCIDL